MEPGMEAISPCFYQQDSLHDTKKAHSTFKGPAAEPAPEKCVSLLGMGSVRADALELREMLQTMQA
eukprot:scaffold147659_cov19-Tisochrysis_lutea.AAC.2